MSLVTLIAVTLLEGQELLHQIIIQPLDRGDQEGGEESHQLLEKILEHILKDSGYFVLSLERLMSDFQWFLLTYIAGTYLCIDLYHSLRFYQRQLDLYTTGMIALKKPNNMN